MCAIENNLGAVRLVFRVERDHLALQVLLANLISYLSQGLGL